MTVSFTRGRKQIAQKLFEAIKADGDLIEDRREYSVDYLARMYALSCDQAEQLFKLIEAEFKGSGNRP